LRQEPHESESDSPPEAGFAGREAPRRRERWNEQALRRLRSPRTGHFAPRGEGLRGNQGFLRARTRGSPTKKGEGPRTAAPRETRRCRVCRWRGPIRRPRDGWAPQPAPPPDLVVVACPVSVDPSFEVPLSFEGRAPLGGCTPPERTAQRFSSRGRRSTFHSIERRAPTPESGNAVEEELEAELKPVLSVGLAVFVEPHEREHEMRTKARGCSGSCGRCTRSPAACCAGASAARTMRESRISRDLGRDPSASRSYDSSACRKSTVHVPKEGDFPAKIPLCR
jgi:hypothetical protein